MAAAAILTLLLAPLSGRCQNDKESFGEYRKRMRQEFSDYKKKSEEDFAAYRKKVNEEYAQFLKARWDELHAMKGVEPPEDKVKPQPPTVSPDENNDKSRKDEEKPYEEVVVLDSPKPQPQPVVPIDNPKTEPDPKPSPTPKQTTVTTTFHGTAVKCAIDGKPQFEIASVCEQSLSDAWMQLSSGQCERLLSECLSVRSSYQLSDWGYIQMLDGVSQSLTDGDRNKATLLMAWLYCQSGYKMRLSYVNKKVYMLYASENIIYGNSYFVVDDVRYYVYNNPNAERLYICNAAFPKEQTMTLAMFAAPKLTVRSSSSRVLQSKRYPSIKVTTSVNKNLIDFYNTYPTGSIDDDFGTRWAMYANTPLSEKAKESLYPQLRRLLAGKSKLQAAEELLNFVQTAFVYEYDDTVWGCDRAFFAEETMFYPYADCEDRSIFYSRLVRDLLDLDVVLLFYPGHLATAVRFEGEKPQGDFVHLPEGNYYVSDPTYIGASIGMTMPDLKSASIKVIRLSK